MKKLLQLVLLVILISTPLISNGQAFKTESGNVEFKSSVPLHSFTGISNKLVGRISLADSTVDFYVDVNTLETGIGKRDRDMLATLEADEYPFAEFYGTLSSEFNPDVGDAQKVSVEGKFTIHGVSNEVTIDGTLQKTDQGLTVKASWTLNMEDYNVKPPGILFYRVSEKIDISIDATLTNIK
jgi:polyisoprenoid-binding protein YceI